MKTITIEKTLEERGKTYGSYNNNARLTQDLMNQIMVHENWKYLDYSHRETLHMIFHKISRIVNGNPNFYDSWHDIEGYARLQANLCEKPNDSK